MQGELLLLSVLAACFIQGCCAVLSTFHFHCRDGSMKNREEMVRKDQARVGQFTSIPIFLKTGINLTFVYLCEAEQKCFVLAGEE